MIQCEVSSDKKHSGGRPHNHHQERGCYRGVIRANNLSTIILKGTTLSKRRGRQSEKKVGIISFRGLEDPLESLSFHLRGFIEGASQALSCIPTLWLHT